MSRLIVLILPLLLLWWAGWTGGGHGDRSKLPTQEVWHDSRMSFEGKLPEKKFPEGDFQVRDLEKLFQWHAPSAEGQRRVKGRRVKEVEGANGALTEMIWDRIDPALKEELDDRERGQLVSYIAGLISPAAMAQPWVCWAPGVSEAKVAAYHEAERLTGLSRGGYEILANQFLNGGRWSRTATDGFSFDSQGDSSIVTWSIVPDGTTTPGLLDQADAGSNLRAWMASIYGGSPTGPAEDQPWFGFFEDAFASIAETCGITLVYEGHDDGEELSSFTIGVLGERGDIRLSARALDGNSGNLALAFGPDHGDIIFDSSDEIFEIISGSSIRLFNTITHELGHSLGLAHVCPINRTKLLEPILTTTFRGAQFDEYQSLQRLYGDAMERHGSFRTNDTFAEATPIRVSLLEVASFPRLSIDGSGDRDFFRFEVLQGQRLEVALFPGESTYLEGAQVTTGCTQGASFDSTRVKDLVIEIVDQDGATILAGSDRGGPGQIERIDLFEFPRDGPYFLKVRGESVKAAQLYELQLKLEDRLPGPRLVLGEWHVVAESGSVKNGRLDPNETLRVHIELENEGELPTGALTARATGSGNVTVFSQSLPGTLASGESGVLELVFGAEGECGDFADLNLLIADHSGTLFEVTRRYELGNLVKTVVFNEAFEGSNDLPMNWSSLEAGSGVAWDRVTTRADAGIGSVFAAGRASVGEASLLSPRFVLASDGGTLSFKHSFDLEAGYDGAVLEVSRDGGAWLDLLEDPAVIVTGGYNRTIGRNNESAIAGQRAWSGKLSFFVSTTAALPSAWAGEAIQFRWRVVHDNSTLKEGWWVDTITMEMVVKDCEAHLPGISLSLVRGALDENFPSRPVILGVQSELPLVLPVLIPLVSGGTAEGRDFQGGLAVTLPAGVMALEVPFFVNQDEEEEGIETLTVVVPDGLAGFVPGSQSLVSLEIADRVDLQGWSGHFLGGPVDLLADSDGDGFSELAEYLLGTDPTMALSRPKVTLEVSGDDLLIPLVFLPDRDDAVLGIEASGNLQDWHPVGFESRHEGLWVSPTEGQAFLRLTFSTNQ